MWSRKTKRNRRVKKQKTRAQETNMEAKKNKELKT